MFTVKNLNHVTLHILEYISMIFKFMGFNELIMDGRKVIPLFQAIGNS